MMQKKIEFTPAQIEIIKTYISLITKKKISQPNFADMDKMEVSNAKIRHHFHSLAGLRKAAKQYSPDTFLNIIDEEIFSPKVLASIKEKVSDTQKFVITTAITGCRVHTGFYEALKRYCKRNKAMLLILPATDPASRAGWELDGILKNEHIVFSDLALNSNCFISSIKLSAKQIDPVTGLGRIGQRQGSFIYASPKQRMKVIANSNKSLPRVMMTTGAITRPNYSTDRYMSERTAYISMIDHVMGALIVEVQDDKIFHFRQIQAEKSGAFADMGVYYKADGVGKLLPLARVFGDYHAGQTDLVAEAALMRLQQSVPANTLVFHDIFNGLSVSHHEMVQHIMRAKRFAKDQLSILNELSHVSATLNRWGKQAEKLVIAKANHDEHLERYLDEGRYVKDPINKKVALQLALAMVDGLDPLKYGVENIIGLKCKEQVRWLTRDEDFKLAGVECGAHGDEGANGGSGSISALEHAYGNAIVAHTHTPEILRGIFRIGTTSLLDLDYNSGPSGWMHTNCDLYPNGGRQLINIINGKYGLADGQEK